MTLKGKPGSGESDGCGAYLGLFVRLGLDFETQFGGGGWQHSFPKM